jgi:hypothetical protein
MKEKIKANQIELFFERKFISDQILRELPLDRRVELENGIVALLLSVALGDDAEAPRGAGHDA